MPSNPTPPRRTWRGDNQVANRQAQRPWQKGAETGPRKPWLSRRSKIVVAAGLTLTVIITIILVLLWPRTVAPQLVLVGADYDDASGVPHNTYGQNGLNDLEAWAKSNSDKIGGDKERATNVQRANLDGGGDPIGDAL